MGKSLFGVARKKIKPTDEQQQAIKLFKQGKTIAIDALAGTGKTELLCMMARAEPQKRGQYIAFSKKLVEDSAARFPASCDARTIHSAAFRAVGHKFKHRLGGARMRPSELAEKLRIPGISVPQIGSDYLKVLPAWRLAGIVREAVSNYCASAARELKLQHFPYIEGIDAPDSDGKRTYRQNHIVANSLLPAAGRLWEDQLRVDGVLPYEHSSYLKSWQLSKPVIEADYILSDESQDVQEVLLDILKQQRETQIVIVGDKFQSIFGWLNCVDAMSSFPVEARTQLQTSFRFGQGIADKANEILTGLGSLLTLTGAGPASFIGSVPDAKAVISRTNALAVEGVLLSGGKGHLIGGSDNVVRLAESMEEMRGGRRSGHPELACFESWDELKEYVEAENGSDLKLMVKLVERFGGKKIAAGLRLMPSEEDAQTIYSTCHTAKGREWESVSLQSDFVRQAEREDGKRPSDEEMRLRYVACTRPKLKLDCQAIEVRRERAA